MIPDGPLNEGGIGAERLYLIAQVGGLTFAVSAASALAAFRLDNLTRAPGAPEHVLGIANTKYGIVAVVCVARWLNAGAPAPTLGAPALLMEHGTEVVALAVEAIDDPITASLEDVASAPAWASPPLAARVAGVIRLGISPIPVLDLSNLLGSPGIVENAPPPSSKE